MYDHAGCLDTHKSTSRGIQFLGDKLVSWISKKQDCTVMSSTEAEYVALSASCAQIFILSEKLHSAISQFDQLRDVRFQDAINRAMPRRKPGRAKTSIDTSYSGNSLESREPMSSKTRNHGEIPAEPMKVQQHLLDDETRALHVSSNDYSVFDSMLIKADYVVLDFKRTVQAQDGGQSYALSWKPCQGDSLNLPDHRIHKDGDGDALFQLKSDSLPHAHAQTTKTYYKHQDSRIMKAQELKTKTSAQTLIYKIFLQRYQVYQGRLLASFQDDAKYEHVGQDTRSQGSKDDQDGRIKI
ncbi:hypothetical protein Tco_0123371 [Tanacetum coccineum]